MLENSEWAINNGQSRETGNIGYTGLQSIFHIYFGCTHDI